MLGITVPDAITLGTILAAALAGWYGKRSGDAAAKIKPAEPATSGIAAGFVDKDLMVRLTMATEAIAGTLKTYLEIQTDEHERDVNDRLKRIEEAVKARDVENQAGKQEARDIRSRRPRQD